MNGEEASRLIDSHLKVLAEHFPALQIIARLPSGDVIASGRGGKIKLALKDRFWLRIDRTGGPKSCWPWTAHVNHTAGHGQININGKLQYTHRIAWILTNGPIADGLCVCHRCDNPPCCNPDHLFLGTHQENMADMHRKGRARGGATVGADNNLTKLTENQVKEIRSLHDKGMTITNISRLGRFPVGRTGIGAIVRGEVWRHLE